MDIANQEPPHSDVDAGDAGASRMAGARSEAFAEDLLEPPCASGRLASPAGQRAQQLLGMAVGVSSLVLLLVLVP